MEKLSTRDWMYIGTLVAAVTGSYTMAQGSIEAHSKKLDDHEMRIRIIERDFLVAVSDIKLMIADMKSEFPTLKGRLTGIEKAVRP